MSEYRNCNHGKGLAGLNGCNKGKQDAVLMGSTEYSRATVIYQLELNSIVMTECFQRRVGGLGAKNPQFNYFVNNNNI